MSRISIDVTPEQHKRLKAVAALRGKTIKEYVLERTLGSNDEKSILELEALLDERLKKAKDGEVSGKSVTQIFDEIYRETEH